jgi:hypothetical protein
MALAALLLDEGLRLGWCHHLLVAAQGLQLHMLLLREVLLLLLLLLLLPLLAAGMCCCVTNRRPWRGCLGLASAAAAAQVGGWECFDTRLLLLELQPRHSSLLGQALPLWLLLLLHGWLLHAARADSMWLRMHWPAVSCWS